MQNISIFITTAASLVMSNIIRIIIALILLWIGFKIIKKLVKLQFKSLDRAGVDGTLNTYLSTVSNIALKLILIIVLLGFVGIGTATLAALLAAAGLAIGLSLQGSLSNFAGGVIILLFKPFKIGDSISTSEGDGVVENIHVFYTYILTADNKVIFAPNGKLSNSSITNLSAKPIRRVDLTFNTSYDSDIDQVKEILSNVVANNSFILKEYTPFIGVTKQGDSSINYGVNVWCNSADCGTVQTTLLETVKKEFDKNNINIPYNTIDVNIKNK